MSRAIVVAVGLLGVMVVSESHAQLIRHSSNERPDIVDVGDPMLISRETLSAEMARNSDLRAWVRLYGPPDYAEVQEIEIDTPFAPYEVRLYYLKGNTFLAFGRVHIAPSLYDYGVRKYIGRIRQEDLDRVLTAQAESGAAGGGDELAGARSQDRR